MLAAHRLRGSSTKPRGYWPSSKQRTRRSGRREGSWTTKRKEMEGYSSAGLVMKRVRKRKAVKGDRMKKMMTINMTCVGVVRFMHRQHSLLDVPKKPGSDLLFSIAGYRCTQLIPPPSLNHVRP